MNIVLRKIGIVAFQLFVPKGIRQRFWSEREFKKNIPIALDQFLAKKERNNPRIRRSVAKDILHCYRLYQAKPNEFFLFDFRGKDHEYRNSFVTDIIKDNTLLSIMGDAPFFNDLKNKYNFYKLTRKYFNRDVLLVGPDRGGYNCFILFCEKHPDVFLKPNSESLGRGASVHHIASRQDSELLFKEIVESNKEWIVEERIEQAPEMSQWNPSSVNTIRICSFRQKDGEIKIAYPFIRMGRKGSVVDNAGQGGVYASVDVQTGMICTDGMDENGNKYIEHPDSHISFKGWQVPQYGDLKKIVIECHKSMPRAHKYIGFDFALTNKGWTLVEGNWGQFLCQQTSLGRGLKKEFFNLLEVE